MHEEYISREKLQIDLSVGSSQEALYAEGLSLHRLWGRVCRCSLRAVTSHSLRLSQCERAKRPRPIHSNRPLLREVPPCASAHDGKQELDFPRPLTAFSDSTFHQDVRRPKFAVPSVAGSFWALSGGNPGVEPSTSGAERLPASLSMRQDSPKVINAPPPRRVCAGDGRGSVRAEGEPLLVRNRITDHE
jgi:hypothetical protein